MHGGVFERSGERGARAEDQGMADRRGQIEKRYTKREIFTLLRQPDVRSARRLRRRGRRAAVLRQARQGPHARGSRDDRRHHPDARAPSPFVNPDADAGAAEQLRAAADGRRRLHHDGRRPRGRGSGRSCSRGSRRPTARSRPTSSRKSARSSSRSTAPTRSTRPACACRRRSTPTAGGRQPRGRSRPAPHRQAPQRLPRSPRATSSPKARRSRRFTHERWSQPILAGDIVPAVVTVVPEPTDGNARVRIGEPRVELPPAAFAWTRKTSPPTLFKVGDLIEVEIGTLEGNVPHELALEQTPIVEGALVAIDNRDRPDSRDGRRLQLRPQQVQPRDAGPAAGGLAVQADRLHGRHRSRLHAGLGLRRRAGVVRARPEPAAVSSRSTTTASSKGRSRCGARSSSRATSPP